MFGCRTFWLGHRYYSKRFCRFNIWIKIKLEQEFHDRDLKVNVTIFWNLFLLYIFKCRLPVLKICVSMGGIRVVTFQPHLDLTEHPLRCVFPKIWILIALFARICLLLSVPNAQMIFALFIFLKILIIVDFTTLLDVIIKLLLYCSIYLF